MIERKGKIYFILVSRGSWVSPETLQALGEEEFSLGKYFRRSEEDYWREHRFIHSLHKGGHEGQEWVGSVWRWHLLDIVPLTWKKMIKIGTWSKKWKTGKKIFLFLKEMKIPKGVRGYINTLSCTENTEEIQRKGRQGKGSFKGKRSKLQTERSNLKQYRKKGTC